MKKIILIGWAVMGSLAFAEHSEADIKFYLDDFYSNYEFRASSGGDVEVRMSHQKQLDTWEWYWVPAQQAEWFALKDFVEVFTRNAPNLDTAMKYFWRSVRLESQSQLEARAKSEFERKERGYFLLTLDFLASEFSEMYPQYATQCQKQAKGFQCRQALQEIKEIYAMWNQARGNSRIENILGGYGPYCGDYGFLRDLSGWLYPQKSEEID